eukprot:311633-Chlamydomonas_euryale.AAC.3
MCRSKQQQKVVHGQTSAGREFGLEQALTLKKAGAGRRHVAAVAGMNYRGAAFAWQDKKVGEQETVATWQHEPRYLRNVHPKHGHPQEAVR